MHTTRGSSETRAISIAAEPDTVIDFLADPHNLPIWAPNFASSVRRDGDQWVVNEGPDEARIVVRVDRECGTVDLLAARDHRYGAFSRVIPNGDGSEYLFTLFFPNGTPEPDIARQMAIVEDELHTVQAWVNRRSD
jgi:Polyketide cyclase / dehydrase and lipid transport